MDRKRAFLLFSLPVWGVALYFWVRFGAALSLYASLDRKTEGLISQWETKEVGGRWALKADYSFEAEGAVCRSSYSFPPPYYLNEMGALFFVKQRPSPDWTVWYNSKNPAQSVLEKKFPWGLLIRALISSGVSSYFIFIRKKLLSLCK